MIQVTPTPYLVEPKIPNIDWAAFHQALAVVHSVVNEAIDPEVSIAVEATHFLESDPNEDDCDFTHIVLTLNCDSFDAFSPMPKVKITQDIRQSFDCADFIEHVEDAFMEIGRTWFRMATNLRRTRRMLQFVETDQRTERVTE